MLDKNGSPFVIVEIFIFKFVLSSCSIGLDFSNRTFAFGLFSTTSFLPKPQFDKNKGRTK